jgi:hypothetical protein
MKTDKVAIAQKTNRSISYTQLWRVDGSFYHPRAWISVYYLPWCPSTRVKTEFTRKIA